MKKLLHKIKTWFVLRWKELQSIQRDKKLMKTEREVRKVEFSKKHPVYTIVTRVIAVLAAIAVAICFTVVSCKTLIDIENQSTVPASAETIPEESSGISAYDLQDVPQFIEIDIPSVPFAGVVQGDSLYAPIEYLIFPRLVIDIQDCSIYRYSYPNYDSNNGIISSYTRYTDISLCPISMWYDDSSYMAITSVFTLDSIDDNFEGDSLDTFYYIDCYWEYVFGTSSSQFYLLNIDLNGNGGYRTYSFLFNTVSLRDLTFSPDYKYYTSLNDNSAVGSNNQYVYYDYLSKLYHNKGYYDGDVVGYNRGYNEGNENGYDEGYIEGDSDGYNRGYDEGYDGGYSVGYNRGISQTLDDVTPWQVIVDGVNKFFGLSILGNSVTIGMIMSIGFGCILFGFAIKIFLGG